MQPGEDRAGRAVAAPDTPASPDRRRRLREQTIDQILQIAVDVMAREGVAGLSLSEVARRMGIQPPSLYKYFPSKLALYDELFKRGGREILAGFLAAADRAEDLGGRTGPELAAMLAAIGPRAIRARRRIPGLLRRQHIGRMYPEEPLPDDRLSYVLDVLGLRDPWMHRVDLARATGRPLPLGDHDHVIVTQVIADLGRAWHGPPVLLELTGPAGGSWTLGHGAPAATIRAGAVDYLRTLSGRNDHPDLQADGDPTAAAAATAARVVF